MASMFGANALTDAFNVAFRIPNLFRRLFAEGAFQPGLCARAGAASHAKGEERHPPADRSVATVLAWGCCVVCVLGVLGAPVLVWLLASGLRQKPEG
jgi:putative peptidoglycan lipid II flippase